MNVRTHQEYEVFEFQQTPINAPANTRQGNYNGNNQLVGTRWTGVFSTKVNSFRAILRSNSTNDTCWIVGLSLPRVDGKDANFIKLRYRDTFVSYPFKSVTHDKFEQVRDPKVKELEFAVKIDPACKALPNPDYMWVFEYAFNSSPALQKELRSLITKFMDVWYRAWVVKPYAAKWAPQLKSNSTEKIRKP